MTSLAIDFPPSESSRLFRSARSQIVLLYGNGFDFLYSFIYVFFLAGFQGFHYASWLCFNHLSLKGSRGLESVSVY